MFSYLRLYRARKSLASVSLIFLWVGFARVTACWFPVLKLCRIRYEFRYTYFWRQRAMACRNVPSLAYSAETY
jgi:hypothetical protein